MANLVMTNDGDDFLSMILRWDKIQHVMKEQDDRFVKTKMLVDGHDFIFFFACRGSIYGANENARSVFSVMKKPMDEPGYEEMSFSATNLSKAMQGEPKEEIFIYKDIEEIKVLNKEVARHLLMKHKKSGKEVNKKDTIVAYPNQPSQRSKDGRIKLDKDFEEMK
jgi:hypothetical protein